VHRDVKPANLLIRRDGSVVITDFGIARHEDASHLTATGAVLGTPSYLSPEQVLGQPATPRSDVYSLGLTAYECLAGERPFVGDNPYAVALQRLQSAPRTIGITLPAPVLRVVERALATDPAGRWPSAAALADAARATATPGAPASPRTPEIAEPGPRRKVIAAAWAAAILVVVVAAAWFITRAGSGDDGRLQAQQPDARTGGATTATATVKGFAACGNAFCPTEPMCWSGLTSISGKAQPPAPVNCSEEHYWETFAAVRLPAGAADGRADELMERPDVAKACSAALMASRSKDPVATRSWRRDAWPIQRTGDGVPLLHCLAGSTDGETTKTIF
jgi:serine/threonine-protein kinase